MRLTELIRRIFKPRVETIAEMVDRMNNGTEVVERIIEGFEPMGHNGVLVQNGKVIQFLEAASGYEKEYCMNDRPGWVSFVPVDVSTVKIGDSYDHDTNKFTPAAA